jgi:hypothetical protein
MKTLSIHDWADVVQVEVHNVVRLSALHQWSSTRVVQPNRSSSHATVVFLSKLSWAFSDGKGRLTMHLNSLY